MFIKTSLLSQVIILPRLNHDSLFSIPSSGNTFFCCEYGIRFPQVGNTVTQEVNLILSSWESWLHHVEINFSQEEK